MPLIRAVLGTIWVEQEPAYGLHCPSIMTVLPPTSRLAEAQTLLCQAAALIEGELFVRRASGREVKRLDQAKADAGRAALACQLEEERDQRRRLGWASSRPSMISMGS